MLRNMKLYAIWKKCQNRPTLIYIYIYIYIYRDGRKYFQKYLNTKYIFKMYLNIKY